MFRLVSMEPFSDWIFKKLFYTINNVLLSTEYLALNKTLSIVYNTFFNSSDWRWLRRNEPKHVAVRYDVKYF